MAGRDTRTDQPASVGTWVAYVGRASMGDNVRGSFRTNGQPQFAALERLLPPDVITRQIDVIPANPLGSVPIAVPVTTAEYKCCARDLRSAARSH